jgi:hypothetical protein
MSAAVANIARIYLVCSSGLISIGEWDRHKDRLDVGKDHVRWMANPSAMEEIFDPFSSRSGGGKCSVD